MEAFESPSVVEQVVQRFLDNWYRLGQLIPWWDDDKLVHPAAQPIGGRTVVVGHGIVRRQILGPSAPSGPAEALTVLVRRYRCRACKAVIMVGPSGLLRGRWYHAGAIATAIVVFAAGGTTATARERTSPVRVVGPSASDRWVTLVRWLEAARRGELFAIAGLEPLRRHEVAEHVILTLASRGGHVLGADRAASAFSGAVIAA
jgi:hypothetical protein